MAGKKAKKADAKRHPYLDLRLRPNAPITLKRSPGKGWGLFATEDIKKDSLIISEDALLIGPADMELDGKSPMHIVKMGSALNRQYERLPAGSKRQLECLRIGWQEGYQELSDRDKRMHDMLHRSSTTERKDASFNSTTDILNRNMFVICSGAHVTGNGLYPIHSRMNHSCVPKVNVAVEMDTIRQSYARCNIKAGSELTFTHSGRYEIMTSYERCEALEFVCDCKACQPGTAFNHLNDIRRIFMRGLEYLTTGRDWENKAQTTGPYIITDPALRKRAEDQDLLLTSRMIYTALFLWLQQKEGLDGERAERHHLVNLERGLRTIAYGRDGVILCEMDLSQCQPPHWLKMFCAVSRLWGRTDEMDAFVTHRTRVLTAEAEGR